MEPIRIELPDGEVIEVYSVFIYGEGLKGVDDETSMCLVAGYGVLGLGFFLRTYLAVRRKIDQMAGGGFDKILSEIWNKAKEEDVNVQQKGIH